MEAYLHSDIAKALSAERDEDTVEVRILRPNELYTRHADATRSASRVAGLSTCDDGDGN
jgi:hypothetical protein